MNQITMGGPFVELASNGSTMSYRIKSGEYINFNILKK